MVKNNTEVEVLPDPKRMIEGLRDTGYQFNTSVADLIDNSIAASAEKINIKIVLDFRGNIRLAIADDGCGMNKEELKDAMKYGAKARPDPASLGKYGLGLKTASTAFCRRLSVVSRKNSNDPLWMATWDLDHVRDINQWMLILDTNIDEDSKEHFDEVTSGKSGTIVIWTKIDRLMKDYQDPTGAHAKRGLNIKIEELKRHVAMVYQRFLDKNDKRARNISIVINSEKIKAWDPFMVGYSELVATESIDVQTQSGQEANFKINAYILPREEEFPSPEIAKLARVAPDAQGIYIYRENRLIVESSWLGLYKIETHLALLRVEFSFDHRLDEAFHLDIKKSQIILNDELLKWLKSEFLTSPRREADRRSRKGQQKKITEKSVGAHINSNNNIRNREALVGGAKVSISDANTNEVLVTNTHGEFKLKIPILSAVNPGEVFVQPVESIVNGLLFEPALIEQKRSVRINTAHPYYHKVYIPNLNESVTIQGMDALLWALCVAELTAISNDTAERFSDMRYEVSRILGKLVETLPEPADEDINDN